MAKQASFFDTLAAISTAGWLSVPLKPLYIVAIPICLLQKVNGFWDERRKLMKLCQEIAYRTQNAEACSAPLPITVDQIGQPLPGYRSVDEIFNREILGVCGLANTVAKAKTFGCLP